MPTKTQEKTDAIQMLQHDHRTVLDLFKQFSELGDRAVKSKEKIAAQIFRELEVHSRLEEEIFYPAVRAVTDQEGEELVDEGVEEHHVVDLLIAELKQMSPEDGNYDAKMTVLCENVQHHIEEEETEMLPDARKRLGEQLETLGMEMTTFRRQLAGA